MNHLKGRLKVYFSDGLLYYSMIKMAFNPERRQAHSEEFGKTDTVVLMSYGKSPEEIAANAKMMRIGSELLTDMTVVGTIKDFK
ncbi:hypothetical protein ACTHTU_08745 [Neisseria sp. P0020.S005]